jgi:hypothetical protein
LVLTCLACLDLSACSDARREHSAARAAAAKPETHTVRDLEGRLRWPLHETHSTQTAIVLVFIAPECPISNAYAPEIERLAGTYGPRGVSFYLVHADPDVTPEQARAHAAEFGFRSRVLLDPNHELVRLTGATVTPEAAVLTTTGDVVYRGRIDDRYLALGKKRFRATTRDLADALDAQVQGKEVAVARTKAVGCLIPN